MANAVDRAVRAQGGAVVKPHQVKAMILAARRAYKMQADAGLVDDGAGRGRGEPRRDGGGRTEVKDNKRTTARKERQWLRQ